MSHQGVTTGSPPKEKEEAIAKLLEERPGYEITSENGQRRYGPREGPALAPPPKGSEVFVGKLPRDVFEDELVPLFEGAGRIREMRLMMDQGSANRGFAFVTYEGGPEDARRAIELLDNHEVRRARHIGVCKSVDNCRLFVGGIPKSKTREEILDEMRRVTESVSRVILYSSVADKSKNRGFAFVEYESHKAAAMARRKLIPGKIPLWGHDIAVDWAEPEPDVDEETMARVTVLYARNLMMSTTEEKIRDVFSAGGKLQVDKVKKLRDFAFVHFRTREDAETALLTMNDVDLDGSVVEVMWAKPADKITRPRCHSRPSQQPLLPLQAAPFIYGQHVDPFMAPPFAPCATPGRGGLLHRVPFRGRGRGAAGMRRFRTFIPNPNLPPPFKPSEVSMPGHSSHYGQYPANKMGRMSDKGDHLPHEYVLMPLAPNPDGLEPTIAVSGPPLLPHAPHHRVPAYLYQPPPGYDEVPYYIPYLTSNPLSSF